MKDTKPFLKDSSNMPRALAGEAAPAALKQTVANGEALPLADTLSRIDALSHINTWVFDLDNTLYPADCDLWPKIDQRITLYLSHLFGLDGMSSRALQKYYYQRYGTSLRGLMEEHVFRKARRRSGAGRHVRGSRKQSHHSA